MKSELFCLLAERSTRTQSVAGGAKVSEQTVSVRCQVRRRSTGLSIDQSLVSQDLMQTSSLPCPEADSVDFDASESRQLADSSSLFSLLHHTRLSPPCHSPLALQPKTGFTRLCRSTSEHVSPATRVRKRALNCLSAVVVEGASTRADATPGMGTLTARACYTQSRILQRRVSEEGLVLASFPLSRLGQAR